MKYFLPYRLLTIALSGILIIFSTLAFGLEPTDLNKLEPIKRGAYTFYTPYLEDGLKAMLIVSPPPSKDTAAYKADMQAALKEYAPSRIAQATQDTRINPEYYSKIYGEILGLEISRERTPAIYSLIARSIADYGLSTYDAKNYYKRKRPFSEFGLLTCSPYAEDYLREDGSYPSGHTASGYGISLVMGLVAPEHKDALINRGKDYAHSRVVCKAHYPSDIVAGMKVADFVLKTQLENKQFIVDLKAAQAEWERLKN